MKNNRIEVIDVLRGFALFGIFLTHAYSIYMEHNHGNSLKVAGLINIFYVNVLFGKFFPIFSFLFGLSFSIQLQNSVSRGTAFVPRFLWRLIILFLIGSIHSLIYTGDVLQMYSLLGVVLLMCKDFTTKQLFSVGLFCIVLSLVIPAFQYRIGEFNSLNAFSNVLAGEFLRKTNWYLFSEGQLFVVAAFFFFGFYAGKLNLLKNYNASQARKLLFISCTIAVLTTALLAIIYFGGLRKNPAFSSLKYIIPVVMRFQQVSLTMMYMTVVVVLYNTKFFKVLNVLNPLGKVGLTIYLLQSILLTLFNNTFAGRNIYITVVGFLLMFIAQVIFASTWTSRFKYGPIEWLWRVLTNILPENNRTESRSIDFSQKQV